MEDGNGDAYLGVEMIPLSKCKIRVGGGDVVYVLSRLTGRLTE